VINNNKQGKQLRIWSYSPPAIKNGKATMTSIKLISFIVVTNIFALSGSALAQSPQKRVKGNIRSEKPTLKPEAIYKMVLPSIMTLFVEKHDGSTTLGTAFLVTDSGIAATAWHVVSGARRVLAKFSNGEEFECSGLVDKDEVRDIALVKVKVSQNIPLQAVSSDPSIGAIAYVIGAPQGLEFSISNGLISQIQMFSGVRQYQFSCPASQGDSGAPLVDEYGKVLGVVSWQISNGQNLNFAVPISYVLGLDKTLPTQPWKNLLITAPSIRAEDGIGSELDSLFAKAFVSISDGERAVDGFVNFLGKLMLQTANHVGRGVPSRSIIPPATPSYMYFSLTYLKSTNSALTNTSSSNPAREKIRKKLVNDIEIITAKIELAINILQAIRSDGWATSIVSENYSKMRALTRYRYDEFMEEHPDALKRLFKSNAFLSSLPVDAQVEPFILFLTTDSKYEGTSFLLGAIFLLRDPLTILDLPEESLAYKLGLRASDRIISAGGIQLKTMKEFKMKIKESIGKTLSVTVHRDGKESLIFLDIPSNLSQ
jgi:S1-C subfamily serine protease